MARAPRPRPGSPRHIARHESRSPIRAQQLPITTATADFPLNVASVAAQAGDNFIPQINRSNENGMPMTVFGPNSTYGLYIEDAVGIQWSADGPGSIALVLDATNDDGTSGSPAGLQELFASAVAKHDLPAALLSALGLLPSGRAGGSGLQGTEPDNGRWSGFTLPDRVHGVVHDTGQGHVDLHWWAAIAPVGRREPTRIGPAGV
jgi:hypothetical protein